MSRLASDYDTAFYARISFQVIGRRSLAVVVVTPVGASLHHWDHRSRKHTVRILRGEDPLAVKVNGTRLVMVSQRGHLQLVNPASLTDDEAMAVTKVMLARLHLPYGTAVVRRDPWIFYPETFFGGIPATWSETDPAVPANAAPYSWVCPVLANMNPDCWLAAGP